MTLMGAILKKVKSMDSISKKYSSPPPEIDEIDVTHKKRRKHVYVYSHVNAVVDSSPPKLYPMYMFRQLAEWRRRHAAIHRENFNLLVAIKRQHFLRGKVDSRWDELPLGSAEYYNRRVNFLQRVQRDNEFLYKRIKNTNARVPTTARLRRDWLRNRRQIIDQAECKFLLFPPVIVEDIEDPVFVKPLGVKRPRVYVTLRVRGGAVLGELRAELFTDVCPNTCKLFLELLQGDGLGYGYVGTCFFRKVQNLYWSGGDVIHNNGYGCYAQRGRRVPIGAENYHFPHSIPGLLSMRMTSDDEMCGSFNITFKPLPQFDLRNVVFGRIIRPCGTYDLIRELGSPLRAQPVVEVAATRYKVARRWVHGLPNTRLPRRVTLRKNQL